MDNYSKLKTRCVNSKSGIFKQGEIYIFNGLSLSDINKNHTSQFELVEDNMTKNDLKVGMVVELRDGSKFMLIPNGGGEKSFINNDYFLESKNFNNDLTHRDCKFDVVKVYEAKHSAQLICKNWHLMNPIWTRTEAEEMTMEEVCKALGKTIKIVKEK